MPKTLTIVLLSFVLIMSADEVIHKMEKSKNTDAKLQKNEKEVNNVNLEINKKTAIKLAEIILESRYGDKVLRQRPWITSEDKDCFKIIGTFHGELGVKGGVAEIVISKNDARVIRCIHGK